VQFNVLAFKNKREHSVSNGKKSEENFVLESKVVFLFLCELRVHSAFEFTKFGKFYIPITLF
jgi:hypothetical protein